MRTLTAREACALLEIKPQSLYAYVSRGVIRRLPGPGRAHLYAAEDVERVRTRALARKGHGAVASGALQWGDPVLDSAITRIEGGRLFYRGREVTSLLAEEAPFEEVVELLWGSTDRVAWPRPGRRATARGSSPLGRLLSLLPSLATRGEPASAEEERGRGRRLLTRFGGLLSPPGARGSRIAARIGGAPARAALVDRILVATADHELNASTFTARVAASAGAELHAAVGAGLFAFSGHRHGAACDRVEAMAAAASRGGARAQVKRWLAAKAPLSGFGHPLYPDGDPRAPPVLAAIAGVRGGAARAAPILALAAAVEAETGLLPTVDFAVVAAARALGLGPGMATALFALGRTAGLIGHVLEQRQSSALLRPRARYVGP